MNDITVRAGTLLKVIFENDYLQDEHKIKLCQLANQYTVAFVKTSTGYGFVKRRNGLYAYQGATEADLKLMRRECLPSIQIKAAGGIRTLDDRLCIRALDVTRVATTATAAILDEAKQRLSLGIPASAVSPAAGS